MRALILAAGEGKRLGSLTSAMPKPMIEIAGKPVLEHNVRLLANYGIRDITINTYFHSNRIVEYFGDGSKFGIAITYSHEATLLGTAGALIPIKDTLTDTFAILFGDNLSTCDLKKMLALHRRTKADATIALYRREDVSASGVAEIEADDRVTRFIEKPAPEQTDSKWVNAGILFAQRVLLSYVSLERPSDLGRDVLPAMLAADRRIYGYRMTEDLYWIDTPQDYERTSSVLP